MRILIFLASVTVALSLAGSVQAKRLSPPKPFHEMTLTELAQFQTKAIQYYKGHVRAWIDANKRLPALEDAQSFILPLYRRCPATGVRMPDGICWYAKAMRWTEKELAETQQKIEARKEALFEHLILNDWGSAVTYVQRVFPGTAAWMMSCSSGEGGHGLWKPYHAYGSSYYPGYEHVGAVGGWMQFMPGTFAGYFHRAVIAARAKGLTVPLDEKDWLAGWLSPLGQAVTAGYMRYIGISHYHWSPSVDYLCA